LVFLHVKIRPASAGLIFYHRHASNRAAFFQRQRVAQYLTILCGRRKHANVEASLNRPTQMVGIDPPFADIPDRTRHGKNAEQTFLIEDGMGFPPSFYRLKRALSAVARSGGREKGKGKEMRAHRSAIAYSVSIALLSLSGVASTANAQALPHCKADAARLCPDVSPGGGKLVACLKEHVDDVSIGCAKEVKKLRSKMGK
jgi:hypothetical protein